MGNEIEPYGSSQGDEINTVAGRERAFSVGRADFDEVDTTFGFAGRHSSTPGRDREAAREAVAARQAEVRAPVPPEPPVGTVFCYQRLLGGKLYTYVSVRTGDGRWWTTGSARQGVTWPELVAALRDSRVQRPVMLAASWAPYAPLEAGR